VDAKLKKLDTYVAPPMMDAAGLDFDNTFQTGDFSATPGLTNPYSLSAAASQINGASSAALHSGENPNIRAGLEGGNTGGIAPYALQTINSSKLYNPRAVPPPPPVPANSYNPAQRDVALRALVTPATAPAPAATPGIMPAAGKLRSRQ
jgi:hypothetical protein